MSVFEEHSERLAAETLGRGLDSLVRAQKRRARHLSEKEFRRWEKSYRHRLATRLKKWAKKLDVDPPEPVNWRTLGW